MHFEAFLLIMYETWTLKQSSKHTASRHGYESKWQSYNRSRTEIEIVLESRSRDDENWRPAAVRRSLEMQHSENCLVMQQTNLGSVANQAPVLLPSFLSRHSVAVCREIEHGATPDSACSPLLYSGMTALVRLLHAWRKAKSRSVFSLMFPNLSCESTLDWPIDTRG